MGELVAGVGDEVLLFGAFLTLTACFYVGLQVYKSYSHRQSAQQARQPGRLDLSGLNNSMHNLIAVQ